MAENRNGVTAWIGRHPQLTKLALLILVGGLIWGGYRANRYYETQTYCQFARESVQKREWDKAAEWMKQARQLTPDSPTLLLLTARIERRREKLDDAEKFLDQCERLLGKESHAIKVERALVRVHRGAYTEVESFLQKCVDDNDPDSVEILDLLSAAYEIQYKEAKAQQCLDELLKRDPDNFDALSRRGRTARNMGWYEDAILYYKKALAIRPEVEVVRTVLAETLAAQGHYNEARTHFEKVLEKQPQNGSLQFGIALCYAGTGQNAKASLIFDQLLQKNPNNWMVLVERGKMAVQVDKPEAGLPDLIKADSLAPPDVPPTALVNCLMLLGKPDEARKYQEKVDRILDDRKRSNQLGDLIRETSPNDPELRFELATILMRLGKARDAVHWYRTALEKDPNHRKTHEALLTFFQSVNAMEQAEYHKSILRRLDSPSR